MLRALNAKGMFMAVASSKPECFVHRILDRFGIEKYFDVIVGSELDGARSAKEEVVEEALLRLGVGEISGEERKRRCAMVGDRKFDIQGARAHGLTGVGVRFGYARRGSWRRRARITLRIRLQIWRPFSLTRKKKSRTARGTDYELLEDDLLKMGCGRAAKMDNHEKDGVSACASADLFCGP